MDNELNLIIKDIVNNRKFKKLLNESHHKSNNRFNHSLDVARYTYKITKKLNLDYKSATRAALLHDFFFKSEIKGPKEIIFHPKFALYNASKITNLNDFKQLFNLYGELLDRYVILGGRMCQQYGKGTNYYHSPCLYYYDSENDYFLNSLGDYSSGLTLTSLTDEVREVW